MNREHLIKIFSWFRAAPWRISALRATNLFCTGITYAAFFIVMLRLALLRSPDFITIALTCGIPFVVLSVFRKWLNWPRPYETYDLPPLLNKETKGRSFPSRHVFSICVIGTSFCFLYPWLGAALLALGAVLAAVRVLSGVHFVRDVLSGAAIGIFSGVVGWMMAK